MKGKRRNELKNEWKEKSPPGGGGERNITIDSDTNGFAGIEQGIFDNRAILLLAGDDDIEDPSNLCNQWLHFWQLTIYRVQFTYIKYVATGDRRQRNMPW